MLFQFEICGGQSGNNRVFYRVNPRAHVNIIPRMFYSNLHLHLFLAEGHPGALGEPSGGTMFFRQSEALDGEIRSFFSCSKNLYFFTALLSKIQCYSRHPPRKDKQTTTHAKINVAVH